ncbi:MULTISPECIES: LOG family protein [Flavobacteriaceae]|uniref:Cytokinin riboside 5'-monophosphate phosphoribohydrolase n=2 Tax=Flavobacteriaceae TaxID=49546 RepID=A0A4Y8AV10_9FLAO|nr:MULTISPECIES: TIGR00730 family Rossman fold protein [Flavobacteriaceae]TEW75196.1 TIGR00730 family Rossman fold protein [Gramella jeungdoensis]GGK40717.1 LOG family protein YvdD [Lutibacter litoralis]
MKKVAVFCGSSLGFNEVYKNDAIKLGLYFADNNIGLVYGGGKIGMMGVIADTIIAKKGEVIGVIPGLLRHEEVAHTNITEMIVTKTMSKRKVKISRLADGYIAMPGGFGTLDEIFEALTLSQLGIEQKPVGILNTNGFFNHLIKQLDVMVTEGYLKQSNKEMLIISDSTEDLLAKMFSYKAPMQTEVINKVVKQ